MSHEPGLLAVAEYGRLAVDHFILDRLSTLPQTAQHDVASEYLELGSEGRQAYHAKANEHCVPLTPTQIHTLKTFFTTAERNLSATATRYGKLVLVRTCYEKGTDAAFGQILYKYRDTKFASVCDDKDRYACNTLMQSAMRCLPFLVETTRFVRCSLMPKERQDKILHLSQSIDCLRDNKVEVDRLLLMDDTHSAFGTLTELSLPDLQRWSSIVGVICLADHKAMDCGLVKLCAFDDQGRPIWGSRISPEGLSDFVAGMERGESVWELRLALRQYESGSGRQYSAYELSTKEIKPSPSSAYDTLRMIAKRDRAEQQKLDQNGEKQNTLAATPASDQEIPVEELDVKANKNSDTTANEMVGGGAESEKETLRELKQKLEKLIADKERAETETAVIMGANEDLHSRVKMLSEGKRMAEEARDEAMLEKDQAMVENDMAIRDAEHAELKYEKFTDQQHNEPSKVSIVSQDTTQKIKYTHSFYRTLISRLEKELAAAQKAQQDTSKRQELEKPACEAAMDRLQKDLVEAVETSHEAAFTKERADGARKDKIRHLNTELRESTKAKQDITVELDRAINREKQALGEETRAEEARAMANVSEEPSYNARLTAKADLQTAAQMAKQLRVDLARKLEEDRAEYAKKLSECVAAKDLAVEQKEAAVLHKLSLGEELARERDRVAEMQKMLEAENRKIIEANDFENRITQRLREEIMAKEEAMNAEDMLASQWGQVLAENGREISDLREQLVTGRSACTRVSEQNELLTRKLAQEVTTNEELKRENQELESELQEMKQKLSAEEEASKEFEVALEEKMRSEVNSKQQIIDGLNNANQELKVQGWKVAARLSKEIANKDQVMREKVELLGQLREGEKKINASHQYAASMTAREAKTSKELEFKNQTIKHSEEFISMLKAEIESASEACLGYKARLAAADRGCGVAKDARIQVEKDLQSQNIRHIEEIKQAQHAIEQASKAKEEAIKQAKTTKEYLEGKLSGEITLKTKLEEDLRLVRVQLVSSQQQCGDIWREYTREYYRSAQLQQAYEQQKVAEENSRILAAHPQARDEEEVSVRAQLERQCQILTEELAEAREAKAKLEMESKEDRIRMAGLLRSADITAQEERMKCERVEEELRVWRDQDGVIALD